MHGGLVWAEASSDYEGPFFSISISLRAVPPKVRGIILEWLTRFAVGITHIDFGGEMLGAVGYKLVDLVAKRYEFLDSLAKSALKSWTFNFSFWPWSKAMAVSLSKNVSVGKTGGSRFRFGFGLSTEIWPNELGGTKFR